MQHDTHHEPSGFPAMNPLTSKLEQNLGWIILLLLGAGCLVVLRPFLSALLWAIVLCFSSWPVYRRLLRLLGQRRTLAALVMSLGMILVILLPFVIVGATLADNVTQLSSATKGWLASGPPAPPEWLSRLPAVGAQATEYWQSLASDTSKLWTDAQRFVEPVSSGLLKIGFVLGTGLIELGLSIFIAFFLFRDGPRPLPTSHGRSSRHRPSLQAPRPENRSTWAA